MFEPINKGIRDFGICIFLPPKGVSILDLGCGTGIHIEIYRRFDCSLYGIDNSSFMLELTKDRLGKRADLRKTDAAKMPFGKDYFDLILQILA